ncbi:MAG: tetratricopeptide repeat protein, partial [Gallionellaceae bacterium]|nr:tetratricopeptide repeat protein [Gallionellaceae bacterium]
MKYLRVLLLLSIAGSSLMAEIAQAADEDVFLGQLRSSPEQTIGQGQTVLWTLPLVATQYQPLHPTPVMQEALQAQNEGRFLDALIRLDEAGKSGQAGADAGVGVDLLRASFLLQGNQSQQTLEILAPLLAQTQYAADAYALTAMAYLQQGKRQKALEAAKYARDSGGGVLPCLALSYALQGEGRLAEAREVMRGFNIRTPQAITLAREAELALTLDQIQPAKALVNQAQGMEAAHPYVIAVSGIVWLIDGQSAEAKTAFETALRRDPKDAKALLGLGLAEIKLGNFQAGQKKLQAADEAEPGNALILTYLGRAQQQAGQTGEAMASWRSAQQADPKDPVPWLYQAQTELQANRLTQARESLRQAQARAVYRSVYRGANLLREDEQLLQANLAEIQRRSGLDNLAFRTLSDPTGEKNAANLRNQADLLQGRRFGESARRSLLLQSQFNDMPGNLPPVLDIYGDGAGQTGASTPQHGVVSGLGAQQASYNNYDVLFNRRTTLEADAISGNQNSNGEQIRLGVGNDTLGLGIAQRQFKTDGNAPFENLDNRIAQAIVQWRPAPSTQAFVSYQTFNSKHGETFFPADPIWFGSFNMIEDDSRVTRLGLRHSLTGNSELRALWSQQQTTQTVNSEWMSNVLPFSAMPPWFGPTLPFPQFSQYGSSSAHSAELEYR